MTTIISKKRLLVGNRRRDWSDVWYEPIKGNEDDDGNGDGTYPLGLFSTPNSDMHDREPMEGEVVWFGQFDIKNCESDIKKERERMQRQILYDAHRYCFATDPDVVRQLEQDLHKPEFVRWESWFRHARKWKRGKMKSKRRRTQGQRGGRGGGVSLVAGLDQDAGSASDSSDISGYETDEATRLRERKKPRSSMAPPPPPRSNGNSGPSRSRPGPGAGKRPRGAPKAPKAPRRSDARQPTPTMSGGLGISGLGISPIGTSRDDSIELSDDDSLPYDAREPQRPRPRGPTGGGAAATFANTGFTNDGREYMTNGAPPTPIPTQDNTPNTNRRLPRLGGGLFNSNSSQNGARDSPMANSGSMDQGRQARAESVLDDRDKANGGLSEEEAIQHALRESSQAVDRDGED